MGRQHGSERCVGNGYTHIRTHESWLYLAVVVYLLCRKVCSWSIPPRMTMTLVLNALLMAFWCRSLKSRGMVHSDQGSQYTSHDWQSFLKDNNLEGSMSRKGNCHNNAVAECFYQVLKRERVERKTYSTREEARTDVFDDVEMFYNAWRRHSFNNQKSPVEYARHYKMKLESVW